MSLIRTSVITTVVLLYSVAHSNATLHDGHARVGIVLRPGAQSLSDPLGLAVVTAQGEHAGPAAAHQYAGGPQSLQPAARLRNRGTQFFSHGLEAVEQPPAYFIDDSRFNRTPKLFTASGFTGNAHSTIHLGGREPDGRARQHEPKRRLERDLFDHLSTPRAPTR